MVYGDMVLLRSFVCVIGELIDRMLGPKCHDDVMMRYKLVWCSIDTERTVIQLEMESSDSLIYTLPGPRELVHCREHTAERVIPPTMS
jgi:hypothetical protein